jgi:hypothetical protein
MNSAFFFTQAPHRKSNTIDAKPHRLWNERSEAMLNMEALDKVIAMVVVILALSLFVQSLQGLLKKLFKIKSLQIEQSLVHLYHYILNKDVLEVHERSEGFIDGIRNWINRMTDNSPVLRMILPRTRHPSESDPQVDALFKGVANEFKKVGRLTQNSKLMLDSISQGDLLKFMSRMPVAGLISSMFAGTPDLTPENIRDRIKTFREKIAAYQQTIELIRQNYKEVASDAEFVELEQTFTPLLTDIQHFLSGADDNSGAILADIAQLKEVDPRDVLKLLDELPGRIDGILARVTSNQNLDPKTKELATTALTQMKTGLADVSQAIRNVIKGFATVQALKVKVETWYDTVMQSFEERYARGMKTWTVIISAVVVILLNANIINIYRDISTSDAKRALLIQAADKYRQKAPQQTGTTGQPTGAAGQTQGAQSDNSAQVTPEQWYADARQVMTTNLNDLTAVGLKGPSWIDEVPAFWRGEGFYQKKMVEDQYYRPKLVLKTILGWLVMTLLLSAGAPFWQDVLESLFGLKNSMRKQTGTENVEKRSGEGQTKT